MIEKEKTIIKHGCEGDLPDDLYGAAIDCCNGLDDGTFWVGNGEYASQVNYCPYCGEKAPVKANKE